MGLPLLRNLVPAAVSVCRKLKVKDDGAVSAMSAIII